MKAIYDKGRRTVVVANDRVATTATPLKIVPVLRLDALFRRLVYAVSGTLFASGAAWFLADRLKDPFGEDIWQASAPYLLMLHGGAAMAMLLTLGALIPLHVQRAWRAKANRTTGSIMLVLNAALILTAFGLYYLGSETLRPVTSGLHIGFGLLFPLLFLAHLLVGRARSRNAAR
jgi:cation transport ATPase